MVYGINVNNWVLDGCDPINVSADDDSVCQSVCLSVCLHVCVSVCLCDCVCLLLFMIYKKKQGKENSREHKNKNVMKLTENINKYLIIRVVFEDIA